MKLRNFPKKKHYLEGAGGGSESPTRTPDSLLSQDYVEMLIGIAEGPIKGLVQPPSVVDGSDIRLDNVFLGSTPLQNPATGEMNFPDFTVEGRIGAETDTPVKFRLGGSAANLPVGTELAFGTAVTRTTPTLQRNNFDRVELRLQFSQLMRQTTEGDTYEATGVFSLQYKPSSTTVWQNFGGQATHSVTGKTTTGYVREFIFDVPALANDDYDIRVTKLTRDGVPGVDELLCDVTWESVQLVKSGDFKPPRLATTYIYGKASNQFSSVPDISAIYDGSIVKVPTTYNSQTRTYSTQPWNGEFKDEYTNNPVWVLWDAINNPYRGMARYYKYVTANRYEFYELAKWCDELVPDGNGGSQPRFTFNACLDTSKNGMEFLNYIAGSFNSILVDDGNGVMSLKSDRPMVPRQIFTPENVTEDGFTYSMQDITERYNDWTVTFLNPDLDYEEDRRTQSFDNTQEIAKNGRIATEFIAVGCTNVHEAVRRANYRYLTATTEIIQVSFTTSRFGFFTERMDTIYVADPLASMGMTGRIKSHASNVIQLRDPLFFSEIAPAQMRVQGYGEDLITLTVLPPSVGNVFSLNIIAGPLPSDLPDRATFVVEGQANAIGYAKPYRVISIEEVDGSHDQIGITAVEINVNKYHDVETGTQSESVKYSYVTPGEPKLPTALTVENAQAVTGSDGTVIQRLHLEWVQPIGSSNDRYEINFKRKDESVWNVQTARGAEAYISPIADLQTYVIRLYAIAPSGMKSQKCLEVEYNVLLGLNNTLESVQNLWLDELDSRGPTFKWAPPQAIPNLAATEIKRGSTGQDFDTLAYQDETTEFAFTIGYLTSGSYRYFFKFRDAFKRYSRDAATFDRTIVNPEDPILQVERGIDTVQVKIANDCRTSQPLLDIMVRQGPIAGGSWDTAKELGPYSGSTRSFVILPMATEDTKLYVRARDMAGNVSNIVTTTIPAAAGDVQELIDLIQKGIDEDALAPALLSKIELIDAPANVSGSVTARIEAAKEEIQADTSANIASLTTTLTSAWQNADSVLWGQVQQNYYTKSTVDSQLTQLSQSLASAYQSADTALYGQIQSTFSTKTDTAQAIASSVDTLQARLSNSGTNLLANSSFEAGQAGVADNWNQWYEGVSSGRVWSTTTAIKVVGTRSQKVQATSIGSTGADRIGVVSSNQDLPSTAVTGSLVTASLYMAGSPGARIVLSFHFLDADGNLILPVVADLQPTEPGLAMKRLSATGTVPANAKKFRLFAILDSVPSGVTAEMYVDAAQVQTGYLTPYSGDSSDLAAQVSTEAQVRATADGYLGAQWALKVGLQSNGRAEVAGIAIAGTSSETAGARFDMAFRANAFFFLPPAGQSDTFYSPMVYYPTATVVNGVTVPAGLYTRSAFIEYVKADQIDTRGLLVKDAQGGVILGAGNPLQSSNIVADLSWLNSSIGSGSNLVPNSDYTSANTCGYGNVGNTNVSAPLLASSVSGWTTSDYIMSGVTRNIYVSQSGVGANDTSCDVYPMGGWDVAHSAPAIPGKKYMASAFITSHRCLVGIGMQFFDAAGNYIDGVLLGYQTPTYINQLTNQISLYQRIYTSYVAPAGAALVRMYIRKYNTFAGQPSSYMWFCAPMLEQVGDTTAVPSAYSPGPANNSAGLGIRRLVVQSAGFGTNFPGNLGLGLRDRDTGAFLGTNSPNASYPANPGVRSYTLVELDRVTGLCVFSRSYDVYGFGTASGVEPGIGAAQMAADLNYICDNRPGNWIFVTTSDEPKNSRGVGGLADAMYRCGASEVKFGSPNFPDRGAFLLVGQANCGKGKALVEMLSPTGGDATAWVSVDLTWNNGALSAGSNGVPNSITDYSLDQSKWDVLINGRALIRAAHIQQLSAANFTVQTISQVMNGGATGGRIEFDAVGGGRQRFYDNNGNIRIKMGYLL